MQNITMDRYHSIIMPLSEEHHYSIEPYDKFSDMEILSVYHFIEQFDKKKPNYRSILNHIYENGTPSIHLLIELLPYKQWIGLFRYCAMMKNYWSDDLIQQIIDNNEICLIIEHLNQSNISDHHQIDISGQYDMNYNFTKKILSKRFLKVSNILNGLFETINVSDFYGGSDMIIMLGCNNWYQDKINLTLYPKKWTTFSAKSNTSVYRTKDSIIVSSTNTTIRIFNQIVEKNNLLILDHGYVDLTCLQNDSVDNLDICVTARLYQYFNNKKNRLNQIEYKTDNRITNYYPIKIMTKFNIDSIRHQYTKCYICKKYYNNTICLKHYESCCLDCGVMSYHAKHEMAKLEGYSVLITGIRAKIGFATALKILRCGGSVIGTTRYPNFAVYNYSQESDYDLWKSRLHIIRCDFMKLESLQGLLRLLGRYKINALICCAFRTIRPSDYYEKSIRRIESELAEKISIDYKPTEIDTDHTTTLLQTFQQSGLLQTSDCQIEPYGQIDKKILETYNPPVRMNQFRDIADQVHNNSWDKKIDQIDPTEIIECTLINQLVPTLLINQMKSQLIRPSFLINVTSLEGQFSTEKNGTHIHTNMCKASMNMLIRSLCGQDDLHVYAVDPGFVSGVQPQAESYPVHMDDGASRILFPIIRYFNDGKPLDRTMAKMRNYKMEMW
jgi:NAD(P)-dependent dehydrogenase (short-subunit alcohol dehydrogenase family)